MTELRELYQETILDHYRQPRNAGRLDRYALSPPGHRVTLLSLRWCHDSASSTGS
jgi:NifU-like protein involved in Fe-S cluster formation